MNWFLIIFAVMYTLEHAVDFVLIRLNLDYLRRHENRVPERLADKISLADYQKSISYTREKSRLGLIASICGIPVFWGLLLSGFFGAADQWVRSFGFGAELSGVMFFGVMSALFGLFSLPFSLYSTFVIEQRYGFNKMTLGLWILDLLKGILLAVTIGVPVLLGVLWFMERYLDGLWWLYVWILLAVVQLFMTTLFPVFIVPIFNKLTPLEEGSLKERIQAIARKVQFKMSGVYTMDGSKRSTHSNAFFAGIGRFRRIVLFDTLIKSLAESELVAVLAHEMGHNVKKHVLTGLLLGLGSSLAGLYVLSWVVHETWFYTAFGFEQRSSYAALFIFSKAAGSFTFFLEPLLSMISRKHEYEADRFAAKAIGSAEPMIQGLIKLTKDNLSNLTPHPLYSFFYYSHPTVMERIRALEEVRA